MKKLFCIFLLGISGCGSESHLPLEDRRIDNIQRILMHDSYEYTFFIQKDNELTSETFQFRGLPKFIIDISAGEPMYVIYKPYPNWDHVITNARIHIHSPQDINGAGWNHGKFGKGQTIPLE